MYVRCPASLAILPPIAVGQKAFEGQGMPLLWETAWSPCFPSQGESQEEVCTSRLTLQPQEPQLLTRARQYVYRNEVKIIYLAYTVYIPNATIYYIFINTFS